MSFYHCSERVHRPCFYHGEARKPEIFPYEDSDLKQGHFSEWFNIYKYLRQPIIMAFNGGPPALELAGLSDEALVMQAQHALESAYALP